MRKISLTLLQMQKKIITVWPSAVRIPTGFHRQLIVVEMYLNLALFKTDVLYRRAIRCVPTLPTTKRYEVAHGYTYLEGKERVTGSIQGHG